MPQLLAHLVGDYIFQSGWMALKKSKVSWICAFHCLTYTFPFAFVTQSWLALAVIFASHFMIDRWGLARYVIWLKEFQRPEGGFPWEWCSLSGYFDQEKAMEHVKAMSERERLQHWMEWYTRSVNDPDTNRPIWIRIWLLIITDNTLHLLCNYLAIAYL